MRLPDLFFTNITTERVYRGRDLVVNISSPSVMPIISKSFLLPSILYYISQLVTNH